MMFNLITVLKYSKALRIACERRDKDIWDGEAETLGIVAFRAVANGMGMTVSRERMARWIGTDALARELEQSARYLVGTRDDTTDQLSAMIRLASHFGAIANRLGYRVLTSIDDDAARGESERSAAE